MMNSNWSNSANWLHNGLGAEAGEYPGRLASPGNPDSLNDAVWFDNHNTGAATLDVPINSLKSLHLTNNWNEILTLTQSVTVTGPTGVFALTDFAEISLAANTHLSLVNLGPQAGVGNTWQGGTITGGEGSSFEVVGSVFSITAPHGGSGTNLGTNLIIKQSSPQQNVGSVALFSMTENLNLTGVNNYIDVRDGGLLDLGQHIDTPNQQNTRGGIVLDALHTGTVAVRVQSGGTLKRFSVPDQGIPDQVVIEGAVYNLGGTVKVQNGSMLKITGQDGSGYSYWQQTNELAQLEVEYGSNIIATGKYQIDIGTVKLWAGSDSQHERLIGAELVFGDNFDTILSIVTRPKERQESSRSRGPSPWGRRPRRR